MNLTELKKINLPDEPGVYFFREKGELGDILYIGKATSLRDRVRSYFSNDLMKTRGPAIIDMVTKSDTVTFEKTDSVLEALILESNLIKKHKPKYNTKEKDDRSYYRVIITDEEFPRVLIVREQELKINKKDFKISDEFGPFPNAGQLQEALKIIQKIFPFYDTKKSVSDMKPVDIKRIGMKISIGLYPNVFDDQDFGQQTTKKEYLNNIKNISAFFSGNKNKILKNLEKEMRTTANKRDYEKAQQIKKQIFVLNHINDINLIKEETKMIGRDFRIEAYDVAHTGGSESVGVMTVFENDEAKKSEYKKFILRDTKQGDDYGGLREILTRRFKHNEWSYPDLIVIDGGKGQKNIANRLLKKLGVNVKVVSVVKDDKHNAREILAAGLKLKKIVKKHESAILQANLESHRFAINFHRSKMRKRLK